MREWLRESSTGLVVLAVLVGAIVFRWLVGAFIGVFSGHADYAAAGRAAHPWLPVLGLWFLLLALAVAGLMYGPLVHRFAPEARGHGVRR